MKKQNKPTTKKDFTYIKVSKDIIADLNHIKYSLHLSSYAKVIEYLISEEVKQYDKM